VHKLDISEILSVLKAWFTDEKDDHLNDYKKALAVEDISIAKHY
jgi:hypothetical protein